MSTTPTLQTISAYLSSERILPKYKHDCDECVYHGRLYSDRTYDVWTCTDSLILRFGSDGDYRSVPKRLVSRLRDPDYTAACDMVKRHERRGVELKTWKSFR